MELDLITRLRDEISASRGTVGDRCASAKVDRYGLRVIVDDKKAFRVMPEHLSILRVQHMEGRFDRFSLPHRVAFDDLFIRFRVDGRLYTMHVVGEVYFEQEGIGFPVVLEVDSVKV